MKKLELYFHIPFCIKKCLYCDFLSAPGDEDTKKKYMEALLTETVGSALQYRDYSVDTVFIGGGTPSAVAVDDIERLMAVVKEYYRLEEDVEVTIEVNPGTVDYEKLCRYKAAGINRLSIGLQSSHNLELAAIGRIHTWEQFEDTYQTARRAGFQNINVDLMSALPGQSLEAYEETLDRVLCLEQAPEHISAYSLILEEGTPFYEMYEAGGLQVPDEDTDRLMYQETKRVLSENGYHRYEISNYAKPGYECRHNCGYWKRKNYVGFGIGAASMVENVRFNNGSDLNCYLQQPLEYREDILKLSIQEQMEEFMFLGLRLTDGVSCREFEHLFGCGLDAIYGDILEKNVRDGLLKYYETDEEAGGIRLALTDKGLDISNYVMAQFLLS